MPRPHIAMRKIRDVLRLSFEEGLSRRQVARAVQLPTTTVVHYTQRARAAGLSWPLPEDLDDAGLEARLFVSAAPPAVRPVPDWQRIHLELRRKGVTLMLLWYEYRETHPDGYAYSQFCAHYRSWARHLDAVMRQRHVAGEKMFVDFPGMTIPIFDPITGDKTLDAELFVAVLGCSSYLYAEAFVSQKLIWWVTGHVHALEFYQGSPAICVCDNLRAGVTQPHRYEPDVNATFAEMAAHYSMAVIPARSYKPRDKAKAESGVLLAERWIIARLRRERFTSLAELNIRIRELLVWINNRPFKKIDGSRQSLFESLDKPALRPLPAVRYELATFRTAKVSVDYHIEYRPDRHYYSVPYLLISEKVMVRITASIVEIFHANRRVASHVRDTKPGFTTDPAHMPESHRRYAAWTPSRIIAWAERTGEATAELVAEIMARRPHPEQGFRSALGIMRLGNRYGEGRLEAACSRALSVRSFSYRSVESILKNGLDQKPCLEQKPQPTHGSHANVRGPGYYR